MTGIVTDYLRVRNSKIFTNTINQTGLFVFIGRPEPWEVDSEPPTPTGSALEQRDVYRSITSYKPVSISDVLPVTYRFNWESGQVYQMYDDTLTPDSQEIPAGTYPYYVAVSPSPSVVDVYLCLYNGKSVYNPDGVPSIDIPIGRSSIPYIGPNDGYIWKYLYTLSSTAYEDHLTSTYLPVEPSTINSVDGEVVCAYPITSGSGMSSNNSLIPYYYCNVMGDGDGACFRFSVRNGQIDKLEMVRRGSGYTYANFILDDGSALRGSNIYPSLVDLDNGTNEIIIGGIKPEFRVILPPPGGYTYDTVTTLNSYYLSINVKTRYGYSISGGDNHFYENMKFRQYGLLLNPEKTNGESISSSNYTGCYAVKLSGGSGNYQVGEIIRQGSALGYVVHWDTSRKLLFYIQTPLLSEDMKNVIHFSGPTTIIGETSGAAGTPDVAYNSIETQTGISFIDGYSVPQIKQNSGYILNLNNIQPVQRSSTQTESLRFILKF
jgi:hypothetical protein